MASNMNNSFRMDGNSGEAAAHADPISPADPRVPVARILRSLDDMFASYENRELEMIDPQGIQAICEDLGVEHYSILKLAWIAKAEKPGHFTLLEWRRGLMTLCVDGPESFRNSVISLDRHVMQGSELTEFYEYAFGYSMTRDMQRFMDLESACRLLEYILGSQYRPQVTSLVEYLRIQTDYKMISFDQWDCFLRFFRMINFPDFSNHRKIDAWPIILDDFVEWMNEMNN